MSFVTVFIAIYKGFNNGLDEFLMNSEGELEQKADLRALGSSNSL